MKITILTGFLIFGILACNKNKYEADYVFTAGTLENMTATNHNLLVEAKFDNFQDEQSISVDIDGDGFNDITAVSIEGKIVFEPSYYRVLKLNITNEAFVFATHPNSGEIFADYTVKYLYNGTFPVQEHVFDYDCALSNTDRRMTFGNIPMFAVANQEVNASDFIWPDADAVELTLDRPAYEQASGEASAGGDSIIVERIIFPGTCIQLPKNQELYLPFQYTRLGKMKYGWLKIRLSGAKIEVLSSAIQE